MQWRKLFSATTLPKQTLLSSVRLIQFSGHCSSICLFSFNSEKLTRDSVTDWSFDVLVNSLSLLCCVISDWTLCFAMTRLGGFDSRLKYFGKFKKLHGLTSSLSFGLNLGMMTASLPTVIFSNDVMRHEMQFTYSVSDSQLPIWTRNCSAPLWQRVS